MVREYDRCFRVLPSRMAVAWNLHTVPGFTKLDSNTVDSVVTPYLLIQEEIEIQYVLYVYGHTYSKSMDQPGKVTNAARGHLISVLCVFFPLILDVKSVCVYQPESHRRKVTQDFSSTFLLRCMPLFLARRIQLFLSLVDREVEICVRFNRSPHVGHF